jgi:hypothetical protein
MSLVPGARLLSLITALPTAFKSERESSGALALLAGLLILYDEQVGRLIAPAREKIGEVG